MNELTAAQVEDESAVDELPAGHVNATVSTLEPHHTVCETPAGPALPSLYTLDLKSIIYLTDWIF